MQVRRTLASDRRRLDPLTVLFHDDGQRSAQREGHGLDGVPFRAAGLADTDRAASRPSEEHAAFVGRHAVEEILRAVFGGHVIPLSGHSRRLWVGAQTETPGSIGCRERTVTYVAGGTCTAECAVAYIAVVVGIRRAMFRRSAASSTVPR